MISRMGNKVPRVLRSALFPAVLCALLSGSPNAMADTVPRMSDQKFSDALVEMTGEYARDVTPGQATRNPYITSRLIVKSDNPALDPDQYGAVDAIQDKDGTYILQFESSMDARRADVKLQKLETTEYSFPDLVLFPADEDTGDESTDIEETGPDAGGSSVTAAGTSMSASSSTSWNIARMGLDRYSSMILSKNYNKKIIVAVLDVGISFKHPSLEGRLMTKEAASFVDGYSADEDESGLYDSHGTHVAGIIAQGTEGLNVQILPVRVLDSSTRSGYLSAVEKGIDYALQQGADVINLSMAGETNSKKAVDSFRTMVQEINSKGAVMVVSAGNQNTEIVSNSRYILPACIPECIVVGSVDSKMVRGKSNTGDTLDVVAPGVGIVGCGYGSAPGYEFTDDVTMSGTSMAAPHVSAEAAALRMVFSSYTPNQIEKIIQSQARDIGTSGKDNEYGYGFATLIRRITFDPGKYGTFEVTTKECLYGDTTPSAPAVNGNRAYKFTGWSPALAPSVTEDATYTAQWKKDAFTINWKNEDGTVLETDQYVKSGTIPTYDGVTPTKFSDGKTYYSFAGWSPAVTAVTGDATYTAVYTSSTYISAEDVTVSDEDVTAITISKRPVSVRTKVKKNKVTVSWKKIANKKKTKALRKQIKAIEVQYSTDREFKNNVGSKFVGKKKTKVKLKLERKTVYYIRVRYVGADGVSKWSKVKRVRTK